MEIDNRSSSTTHSQSDTNNSTPNSFGHRFKQARVSQGVSLEEVASELFILRRHLEAIENEDFAQLPQLAFARGFVINYAKFLNLDPVAMAESFNRAYPEELKKTSLHDVESPLRPMGTLQREGERSSWRINPLLVIGVIGVIVLAVFLLRIVSNAQNKSGTAKEAITVVDELSDSEQVAGAAINTNSNSSGSALDLANTGSAINSNLYENASLDLNVLSATPLTITDATGKALLTGVQSKGDYNLSGTPPFNVQIGNISQVALSLNGQAVDLDKYASTNSDDSNNSNNKVNFTLASQ